MKTLIKWIKNQINLWKLRRLQKKIDNIFDTIGCDELFYLQHSDQLYAIWWDRIYANLQEVTDKKEERVRLIKEYVLIRDRTDIS